MESADATTNDVKELTFERWKYAERRCYYLLSASGAAIGYALLALRPGSSALDTLPTSIAVLIWAVGIYWGRLNLVQIQGEIEEVHRNMLVPSVYDETIQPFLASWTTERDRLLSQQRDYDNLQFFCLALGGIVYSLERLGWLDLLISAVASQ